MFHNINKIESKNRFSFSNKQSITNAGDTSVVPTTFSSSTQLQIADSTPHSHFLNEPFTQTSSLHACGAERLMSTQNIAQPSSGCFNNSDNSTIHKKPTEVVVPQYVFELAGSILLSNCSNTSESQNSTPFKSPLQQRQNALNVGPRGYYQDINNSAMHDQQQFSGAKPFNRGQNQYFGRKGATRQEIDDLCLNGENATGYGSKLMPSYAMHFSMTEIKEQQHQSLKNAGSTLPQNVLQPLPLQETDLMNTPTKNHHQLRKVASAQKSASNLDKMAGSSVAGQGAQQFSFTAFDNGNDQMTFRFPVESIKENSPFSESADSLNPKDTHQDHQLKSNVNGVQHCDNQNQSINEQQSHFFQTSLLQEDSSSNLILHNESSLLLHAGGVCDALEATHKFETSHEEHQHSSNNDELKDMTSKKGATEQEKSSVMLHYTSSQKSPLVSQIKCLSSQLGLGPSSLLQDCYSKNAQNCSFQGDRFVPMRPIEHNNEGTQQFGSEQMHCLMSKKRKRQSNRGANPYSQNNMQAGFDNSDDELLYEENIDGQSERSHTSDQSGSSSERTLSANSSSNDDEDDEMEDEEQMRRKRKSRQRNARHRRELYQDLLQQQCYGEENLPQLQKNNLSLPLPALPIVDQDYNSCRNGLYSQMNQSQVDFHWQNSGEHQLPPLNKLAEIATKKAEKPKRNQQILKFKKREQKIFLGSSGASFFGKSNSQTVQYTNSTGLFAPGFSDLSHFTNENLAPVNLVDLQRDANLHIDRSLTKTRKISKVPYKVLDAPQLQDDFYLNLVDWSATNVLAVGLLGAVYIWSAANSQVQKLCEVNTEAGDQITSVNWSQKGNHLAVGTHQGQTQIWDAVNGRLIRQYASHQGRVSALAWNQYTLSTGSRDGSILQRDSRQSNQYYLRHEGHKQEVCGLKWSYDNMQLASGGNDNKLLIWSLNSAQPMAKFNQHTAAVKAIGWSPHQSSLLATGGGTADRHIRFWNTLTLQPIFAVDTGSQVCNLMFSKNSQEIVSTHGYSQNQVILWKFPTMQKIRTLTGHQYRVLYLSMSPDGENIVTGAGDETLRFWNVFPRKGAQTQSSISMNQINRNQNLLFPSSMDLR